MPGVQFKLDLTIHDSTFPLLTFDPIMPAAGALILIDPAHPHRQWPAGVPSNGTLMPNLAAEQSAATIGQGSTAADLAVLWRMQIQGTVLPTVERTSTGGLYVANKYAGIFHPAALIDHLQRNRGHSFYVSQWGRLDATEDFLHYSHLMRNGSDAALTGTAYEMKPAGSNPAGTRIGQAGLGSAAVGPYFVNAAHNSNTLAGATGAAFMASFGALIFGTYGNGGGSARRLYRFYMEDLTVSGRTYETVAALDRSEYTKHVLTPGGRYYGDARR